MPMVAYFEERQPAPDRRRSVRRALKLGVVAGFAVALIAGTRPYLHLVPMCALIVAETAYLYSRGLVDGPIWFEVSAGLSLIIGALAGAYCWSRFITSRRVQYGELA